MAEERRYFLWLQRIRISGQASNTEGIPVTNFSLSDSHNRPGSSVGAGKARFDLLNLTIAAGSSVLAQFSVASTAGANLGRGRLESLMPSGRDRLVLDFESALVNSVSVPISMPFQSCKGLTHFDLQISIDTSRGWRPLSR